jgi:hypothetical protein
VGGRAVSVQAPLHRGLGELGEPLNTVGLRLPPDLDYERWREIGESICRLCSTTSWALGDWLFFGEWAYGRRYEEAMELTGLAYQTCADLKYVAGRFDHSRRREELSVDHHRAVASLPPDGADAWLARASAGRWTRARLRDELAAARAPRLAQASDSAAPADQASADASTPAPADQASADASTPAPADQASVSTSTPAPPARPAIEPAVTCLTVELTAERAARWQKAATRQGLELTAWVVAVCDQAAARRDRESTSPAAQDRRGDDDQPRHDPRSVPAGITARTLLEQGGHGRWLHPVELERWLLDAGLAVPNGSPHTLVPTARGLALARGLPDPT